jgi:DNA-binding beta-propeller fold protein YncE
VFDARTMEFVKTLPSGPDPELFVLHPSGNPLYIANEDDNLVTVVTSSTARCWPRSRSVSSPRAWASARTARSW